MRGRAKAKAARLALAFGAVLVGAGPAARATANEAAGAVECPLLRIEPRSPSVAVGSAVELRAVGGSGRAVFRLATAGPSDGQSASGFARRPPSAWVEPGGGLHAGDQAGRVDVVAQDAVCGTEARATVEVTPRTASAERRASRPPNLRPRAPILALPPGARVRLDWIGGSGRVDVSPVSAGRVVEEAGALWFSAQGARPGAIDIHVTDRTTRERASVRVVVGATFGPRPLPRGTQSLTGALATGDVNGDGKPDLIIGHAERSKTGLEAGGVLVHYGRADGIFADTPDLVIEGRNAGDRYASVLLVADANGDGIDDVLVGSPEEALGESGRGAVDVYLGSRQGLGTSSERVLAGEDAHHLFGSSIALRDLTGDGAPELIVSAPGAHNPFAKACDGGRVYVYRSRPGYRGVFEAAPWQTIDLRAPTSDVADADLPCSSSPAGAGSSLAVIDMDGDRQPDLAVGAPLASYPSPGHAYGAVLVYRGRADGSFASEPSWAIELDAGSRVDNGGFGSELDVVEDGSGAVGLVVRSAAYSPRGPNGAIQAAGGLWVFAPGSLGAASSVAHRVRVMTTRAASAWYFGKSRLQGVGRSAAVADVDGDGKADYVVGRAWPGAPGGVLVFDAGRTLKGKGALVPSDELGFAGNDMEGLRLAASKALGASGLSVWAPWRAAPTGPFVGAIDYVPAARGPLHARWAGHRTLPLTNFGASDRAGAAVALGNVGGREMDVVVGAPGAHSPADAHASPPLVAGAYLRTGVIDVFATDGGAQSQVEGGTLKAEAWIARANAQLGGGPLAILDFDGDGKPDLAVGDPNEAAGGDPPEGFVDPDGCSPLDANGKPTRVGGRGVVRIYSMVDGALVERFRLTAPREPARADAPTYLRNHFGSSLAVADVNGDKRDDLVVGRPGGRDASGAEVVLGRKADPKGRVLIACNGGDSGPWTAFRADATRPGDPLMYGAAVAGIGDVDRDGCDEIAMSEGRANVPGNPPRAGVLIAFGYDATGKRCAGHRTPFVLHLVADDHPLDGNVAGDLSTERDDTVDLRGAPTSMGSVLARGKGDVTGDGVPDLVFRADAAVDGQRVSAVEIVSGAYLARLCPGRFCRPGRSGPFWSDGDWHVLAMRGLGAPERVVVGGGTLAPRFGASLALGDLTGDGVAELVVGSPDDSDEAAFAGEVRIYRGGPSLVSLSPAAPWMIAVGDVTERSLFGGALDVHREGKDGWLVVGAPSSSRSRTGGGLGAAYLFRVEGGP